MTGFSVSSKRCSLKFSLVIIHYFIWYRIILQHKATPISVYIANKLVYNTIPKYKQEVIKAMENIASLENIVERLLHKVPWDEKKENSDTSSAGCSQSETNTLSFVLKVKQRLPGYHDGNLCSYFLRDKREF